MMNCSIKLALVAVALSGATADARSAPQLPEHWVPAMLFISAGKGIVDSGGSSRLEDVHPLVTLTRSLEDDRHFDAFPIGEFARSYTDCNAMKDDLGLWHDDGANAMIVYSDGPSNGAKAGHLRYSPLVTSPQAENPERVTGGKHAAMAFFIKSAVHDPQSGALTFTLRPDSLASGIYENVVVKTECLDVLKRIDP